MIGTGVAAGGDISFIKELRPKNSPLRANFRKKFLVIYGIDIGND